MKNFLYGILLLMACNINHAQEQPLPLQEKAIVFPEVGKPMPDFTLNDIRYYDKQQANLKDFRGKWLILDFWNRLCKSCISSFPKVNGLRKIFKGKVEFVLVGRNDGRFYSGAERIFQRARAEHDLKLPLVYDTNLYENSGLTSVPHIIWIDDKGIVRAVTSGADLNAKNLNIFLSGGAPKVSHKPNAKELQEMKRIYDWKAPLLIDGNGGKSSNFLYRSLLTGKNKYVFNAMGASFFYPLNKKNGHKFSIINSGILHLYKLAYGDTIRPNPDITGWPNAYGKWWRTPILEVSDSSEFKQDWNSGKGIYCYELIVPKDKEANTLYRQSIMQGDLLNYFGYHVQVETRLMPYWKVIANKKAKRKLISKGAETAYRGDYIHEVDLVNVPMAELIRTMWSFYQVGPPFVDETGIKQHIDIRLTGTLTNFEAFRQALSVHGLELMKSKKEMKVIVIRDPILD